MKKKVLSEQSIYTGDILMPKGFEIEEKILTSDILESKLLDDKFKFSKTFDRLHTYISENIHLKYGFTLINKNTFGEVYEPKEVSPPLLNVDPVDLRHSPDFTFMESVLMIVMFRYFMMITDVKVGLGMYLLLLIVLLCFLLLICILFLTIKNIH